MLVVVGAFVLAVLWVAHCKRQGLFHLVMVLEGGEHVDGDLLRCGHSCKDLGCHLVTPSTLFIKKKVHSSLRPDRK